MMKTLVHRVEVKITLAFLGCMFCLAAKADLYIYKNAWGSSLFSDRPIKQPGFQLVERRQLNAKGKLAPPNGASHDRQLKVKSGGASRFDQQINQCALHYDVDPALVKAVIHVESHFNPHAVSRVGAQGLMQLMPRTAAMYKVSNPFDPQENIRAGCRHLQYLIGKFSSIDLVLAAYNAGEGTVAKYNGIPPYSETRDYVRKVKRLKDVYKDSYAERTL